MVAQLRKDLGAEDVPFVAGELPRFLSRYAENLGRGQSPVFRGQSPLFPGSVPLFCPIFLKTNLKKS